MNGIKITMDNLGPLRHAELEPGKFTILCGENNTGKTYATYVLFGLMTCFYQAGMKMFADLWLQDEDVDTFIKQGELSWSQEVFLSKTNMLLEEVADSFQKELCDFFSSEETVFLETKIRLIVNDEIDWPSFESVYAPPNKIKLSFEREKSKIVCSYLGNVPLSSGRAGEKEEDREGWQTWILYSIFVFLTKNIFPDPFITTVERTGTAIFQKGLDIRINSLLEAIVNKNPSSEEVYPMFFKSVSTYPWPVNENIKFVRELEKHKKISEISRRFPLVAQRFREVSGGDFELRHGSPVFVPMGADVRLDFNSSSSSVRALFHLGVYLARLAKPGDLLIIDEPELNLHPQNQRRMARLLALLSNLGVNIMITTHSDYLIRELNTLLLLRGNAPHLQAIRREYGYEEEELLPAESLKLYMAEKDPQHPGAYTLIPFPVSQEEGITVPSMDRAVDEINQIQDAILYGAEEDMRALRSIED